MVHRRWCNIRLGNGTAFITVILVTNDAVALNATVKQHWTISTKTTEMTPTLHPMTSEAIIVPDSVPSPLGTQRGTATYPGNANYVAAVLKSGDDSTQKRAPHSRGIDVVMVTTTNSKVER